MRPNKYNHYIFDFDGTLADTIDLALKCYNLVAQRRGLMTIKDIDAMSHLSSKEVIKFLNINRFKLPFIIKEVRKLIHKQVNQIKLFDDIPELILELQQQGKKVSILSTNSQKLIQDVLTNTGINSNIDIHTSIKIFGKSKPLKKIANCRYRSIYIGDETRDIEAAKKANIDSIAVSWGYTKKTTLEKQKPTFVINHPMEILTI